MYKNVVLQTTKDRLDNKQKQTNIPTDESPFGFLPAALLTVAVAVAFFIVASPVTATFASLLLGRVLDDLVFTRCEFVAQLFCLSR